MFTPYLMILTMFSGAGEIIDPIPHASLASCKSELVRMQIAVNEEWAVHGILRMKGECRPYYPVLSEFIPDEQRSLDTFRVPAGKTR